MLEITGMRCGGLCLAIALVTHECLSVFYFAAE